MKKTNNIGIFLFIIIILYLSGCSGTKYPHDRQVNMIFNMNILNSDNLISEIPEGWFIAEDNSIPKNILILFLEEKYRAAMTLSEFKISKNSADVITRNGLKELAGMSFAMKKENSSDSLFLCSDLMEYEDSKNPFIVYDYKRSGESDTARIMIFRKKEKFYELSAVKLSKQSKTSGYSRDSLLVVQYNVMKKIKN